MMLSQTLNMCILLLEDLSDSPLDSVACNIGLNYLHMSVCPNTKDRFTTFQRLILSANNKDVPNSLSLRDNLPLACP